MWRNQSSEDLAENISGKQSKYLGNNLIIKYVYARLSLAIFWWMKRASVCLGEAFSLILLVFKYSVFQTASKIPP